MAEPLYQGFVSSVRDKGVPVQTGRFRADMKVHSLNDGPVTMLIDSREGESRSPGAATPSSASGSPARASAHANPGEENDDT